MSGWDRAAGIFWMLVGIGVGSATVYELATKGMTGAGWAAVAGIDLLCGLGWLLLLIEERG